MPSDYGYGNNEYIRGTSKSDFIVSGSGNDTLYGEGGDDEIYGEGGNDFISGGSGNDNLEGWGGNDEIYGGNGNDMLVGGDGADTLNGGSGSDQFVYLSPDEGGDRIYGFDPGRDKIAIAFGGGLSRGVLPESSFVTGSAATNSQQRFIFDNASRELFFDIDGNGSQSPQSIATFIGGSIWSADDILLI